MLSTAICAKIACRLQIDKTRKQHHGVYEEISFVQNFRTQVAIYVSQRSIQEHVFVSNCRLLTVYRAHKAVTCNASFNLFSEDRFELLTVLRHISMKRVAAFKSRPTV
jgi:hypothetical protein